MRRLALALFAHEAVAVTNGNGAQSCATVKMAHQSFCNSTPDMVDHTEHIWDGEIFSSYHWNWWHADNTCGVTVEVPEGCTLRSWKDADYGGYDMDTVGPAHVSQFRGMSICCSCGSYCHPPTTTDAQTTTTTATTEGSTTSYAPTSTPTATTTSTTPTTTTTTAECTGTERLHDSETSCSPTEVSFRVSKCAFENARMDPAEVYMAGTSEADRQLPTPDNSCTGQQDGNDYNFSVVNSMTDCGTILTSNATHFTYTNAIQLNDGMSNSIISRRRRFLIQFSCTFAREETVSTGNIMATMVHVSIEMDQVESQFDISMGVFTDSDFQTPVGNDFEISVPDPIHVEMSMNTNNDRMKLRLESCWATASDDPTDPLRYAFIENFCGDWDEINVYQALIVSENGVGHTASFSIDSFAFHGDTNLFLHCNANVCDSSSESCIPDCSNVTGRRRRRDIGISSVPLVVGPIRILARPNVH